MRGREVTPVEFLEAPLEQFEARNPQVNAVVRKVYDLGRGAIADAVPDTPFSDVPFAKKDLTASIAGARMTRRSRFLADAPLNMWGSGFRLTCRTTTPTRALHNS